ncbi:uncharacterized protein [Clytia hemisphaerica]
MDNKKCIKCGRRCEISNIRKLCASCNQQRTPNVKLKKRTKLQEYTEDSSDDDYIPPSASSENESSDNSSDDDRMPSPSSASAKRAKFTKKPWTDDQVKKKTSEKKLFNKKELVNEKFCEKKNSEDSSDDDRFPSTSSGNANRTKVTTKKKKRKKKTSEKKLYNNKESSENSSDGDRISSTSSGNGKRRKVTNEPRRDDQNKKRRRGQKPYNREESSEDSSDDDRISSTSSGNAKRRKIERGPENAKKANNIEVTEDIIKHFGIRDPLTRNKKQYNFKCPYKDCPYDNRDLKRHLTTVHTWTEERSKLEVSCRLKMFKYLNKRSKTGVYKPRVCKKCNICVERFTKHLQNSHKKQVQKEKCIKKLTKRLSSEPKITIIQHEVRSDQTSTSSDSDSEKSESYELGGYMSVIKNSKKLSERKKRELKIQKGNFCFLYETYDKLATDFITWVTLIKTEKGAKQAASNLSKVWKCIDSELSLYPNMLADSALLEDKFFLPLFIKIRNNSKNGVQNNDLKPSTVMGRLSSIKLLLDFVTSRRLYIGLTSHAIQIIRLKLKEFHDRLKIYHKARERFMQTFKSNRILTPSDMEVYGGAPQIQETVSILNEINKDNSHQYSQKEAVCARNHLMVIITVGNAARASNLINLSVEDVENAVREEEFDAFAIASINYKTSLLYGIKKLLLGNDLLQQLKNFIEYLRPKITINDPADKHSQPVFTSCREKGPMSHSAISNAMTSIFKLIPEFALQERFQRISPTKLRHSVATQLAGIEKEDLKTVAMQFMKNRPSTTSRYYVCIWAQREASRLSMKCYGAFNISDTALKNAKVPTPDETKKWFTQHKAAIKADFGEEIEDEELMKEISKDDGLDALDDEEYLLDTDSCREDSLKTCKTDDDSNAANNKLEKQNSQNDWYRPRNIKREIFLKVVYLCSGCITGTEKISESVWNKKRTDFNDDELKRIGWPTINELLKSMRKKYNRETDHFSFDSLLQCSTAHVKDLLYQDDQITRSTNDDSILSLAEDKEAIDFQVQDKEGDPGIEKTKLLFDAALPEEDSSFSDLQTVSSLQKKPASINTKSTTSHESTKSNKELSSPIQKDQTMSEEYMLPFKKKSSSNENKKTKLLFDAALPEEDSSFSDLQTVSSLQKKPASINTKSTTSHESTKSNKELSFPIQKDQTMSEDYMLPFKKKSSSNENKKTKLLFDAALPEEDPSFSDLQTVSPLQKKPASINTQSTTSHESTKSNKELSSPIQKDQTMSEEEDMLPLKKKSSSNENKKTKLLFDAALPEEDSSFSDLQTVSPLQKKPASINTQSTTSHESTKSNKELSSPIQKDQTMSEEEDMLPLKKKSSSNENKKTKLLFDAALPEEDPSFSDLQTVSPLQKKPASINTQSTTSHESTKSNKELSSPIQKDQTMSEEEDMLPLKKKSSSNENKKTKLLFDAALPEEDSSFSDLQTVSPLQKKPASINTKSTTSHESTKSNKELSSPIQKDQTMSEEEDMLPFKKKSSPNESMSIWYQPRAFKKKTIMSVLYLGHDIVVGRESLSECDDNKMVKLSGLKIKQAKEILKTMRKKYNKESDHTLFQAFYEKAKLLFDAALPEEDPSFSYLQTVSPLQKKPASINTQSTTSHESTKSNKELSSPIQKDQTMSEEEDMLPFKKKSSPNESTFLFPLEQSLLITSAASPLESKATRPINSFSSTQQEQSHHSAAPKGSYY